MNEASPSVPATLVPPRPNLGPEPFDEPSTPWAWVAGLALAGGLSGLWAWRRRRGRSRRSRAGEQAEARGTEALATGPPADEIVRLAETARASLAERFGVTMWARTTEEIAGDAGLDETIGAASVGRLTALLRLADRAKFAASGASDPGVQRDEAEAWALWVTSFVGAAGARSTISGK